MARLPTWMRSETVGTTERGNLGVRLVVKRWAVPFLWLVGIWRLLTRQLDKLPFSCDGLEVVDLEME